MEMSVTGTICCFFVFLELCLIPYMLPILMPTWCWLLALTLVGGGLLTSVWIHDWVVSSASGYEEVLDAAIQIAVTIGFVSGVGISTLTLFLRCKKLPLGYRLTINIAGLPATVTVVTVLDALRVW